MLSRLLTLWACAFFLCPGLARAADVVLLPGLTTNATGQDARLEAFETLLRDVLTDNELVVLTAETVRPLLGSALDVCPTRARLGCAQVALMSLPARLALVVHLEEDEQTGGWSLALDVMDQLETDPVRSARVSLDEGLERRAALEISMLMIDVFQEVGASPNALVQAARRMIELPEEQVDGPFDADSVDDTFDDGFETDDLESESLDLESEDLFEPSLDDLLDQEVDDLLGGLSEPTSQPSDKLPARWFLGVRRRLKKQGITPRGADALAWYRDKRPHGGRFLLELRGGFAAVDVQRSLLTMGAMDDNLNLTAVLWEDGSIPGFAGLLDLGLGYAPAASVELMVMTGVHFSTDELRIGYMTEGSVPVFGEPTKDPVVRPYVQPRMRFLPVVVGVAKPFFVVGGQFTFVGPWRFNAPTAQPFPRPPGGVLYDVLGGVGLVVDPVSQLGIVFESTFHYHLGPLSGPRVEGTLVGDPPLPPQGRGWKTQVSIGLQARF